jgi:hypothetical protein
MPTPFALAEPTRVEEPRGAQDFSDALTRVASDGRPVIVRRDGQDLAAVIPVAYLELIREALERQEAEKCAAQIDWDRVPKGQQPPQSWFDDDDNPFEPDEEPAL